MIVTRLEEATKTRIMVFIDDEFSFVLYKGELKTYDIRLNEEIKIEDYNQITKELLPRRAKLRAMNLLKTREYTEKQISDKLCQGKYPKSSIEEAISYLKSFHYIDDMRYAKDYILYKSEERSYRRIEQDLLRKGISHEILEQAFQNILQGNEKMDEKLLIDKLLHKKKFDKNTASYQDKQKIMSYLYRKGFSIENIREKINSDK